jgi:mono/diheme cytochrome c family protein
MRSGALHLTAMGLAALIAASATAQQPAPFANGDAKAGATIHAKDCVACHARLSGGDGSALYTRPEHKVTTAAKLRSQVAFCNTQLSTHYFPEEEEHLAAYLNLRYYHFQP